jgi:hypothetical protein
MNDKKKTNSAKKNTFILKKLDHNNNLSEEIEKTFEDPTKYLTVNPNLIVGKFKIIF